MWRKITIGFLALLVALGITALWQRDKLVRLSATISLFAPENIVANFSSMGQIFETAPIPVSRAPDPLPVGDALALPDDWTAWLARRSVTGVVILKAGEIRHASYHLGTGPDDARISWSTAKSFLSALYGIALRDGAITSLDDQVTQYVPELVGTAYDGVTIRNVLQMSSGVTFDEDYLDFWSDINKMGRILALGGSMDKFAAKLDARFADPGETWKYVSIDTHVLGMVLRNATGQSLAELLGTHILDPLGTYGSPHYLADGYGVSFALGGLNLTVRDYARMGEMFRNDGTFQGRQIVPADWVLESTTPSAKTAPGAIQYGYQWWIPSDARDGEFLARGVYGQYVYINRDKATVVAVTGADRSFRAAGAFDDSLDMFRRISALDGTEK